MSYKITDDCIMCGTCKEECPAEAIKEGNPKFEIDSGMCTECATCADVCPVEACVPD